MYHPSRGGVRGGQDQFDWEDVKADKHRESYLGHSVKAPVGRWQKGKDLHWYTKSGKVDSAMSKQREKDAIKKMEAEALAIALGKGNIKKKASGVTKQELAEVCRKGQLERDSMDIERVEGMGFGSSQFSGHCWRSKNEIVSQLLLWDPKHDRCSRGRPATTFIDQLDEDTSLFRLELPAVMADRGEWDKLIKSVSRARLMDMSSALVKETLGATGTQEARVPDPDSKSSEKTEVRSSTGEGQSKDKGKKKKDKKEKKSKKEKKHKKKKHSDEDSSGKGVERRKRRLDHDETDKDDYRKSSKQKRTNDQGGSEKIGYEKDSKRKRHDSSSESDSSRGKNYSRRRHDSSDVDISRTSNKKHRSRVEERPKQQRQRHDTE